MRLGFAILATLLAPLVACAPRIEPMRPVVAPPAAAAPSFQDHLDASGVPLDLPDGKAIVVNVPAFELIAFEDALPILRSRVIVGAEATPTPLIETATSVVRFRPSWRPTPTMIATGAYEDRRWPPGRNNPLGLAAIRLEPGLLVYLHDTNRRDLFAREDRAMSFGCVRVERWDELIAWLLDWDLADVHRLAEGSRTVDVATEGIPVIFGYFLTFPADDGTAQRFADVYNRGPDVRPTDRTTLPTTGPACGGALAGN
ncbi:MAG: hypothetical protein EA356_11315 [Geminicoccaceae bacterium]|nr:MAG: hypothetical protein EA356_11315 [Geminicoccaceae bacterium]